MNRRPGISSSPRNANFYIRGNLFTGATFQPKKQLEQLLGYAPTKFDVIKMQLLIPMQVSI